MSDRISSRLALLTATALLGVAVVGCTRSVHVNFEGERSRLESAARHSLAVDLEGSEKAAIVELPAEFADLCVDGRAWHVRKNDRDFVFFPQSIDGQTLYVGLLYAVDDAEPQDVLASGSERLAPHWWQGELSGEFLACSIPATQLTRVCVRTPEATLL